MSLQLPEETKWAVRALQGLAFWIGHRDAMYNGYPLSEGALVAETCNLIHTALSQKLVLRCEELYSNLLPPKSNRIVLKGQVRADLVIAESAFSSSKVKDRHKHVQYIIEVKRASAPAATIVRDLQRLHEAVVLSEGKIRGLQFLVTEQVSAPPKGYVTSKGASIKGIKKIQGEHGGYYVVRRTCKASAKFESYDNAYYACLIEVFEGKPQKRESSEKLAKPIM